MNADTPGALAGGRTAASWRVLFWLAVLAGAAFRVYQLPGQILLDDEWHAIHKLLASDVPGILSHLGIADYSIPLTVYYRCLYDLGMLSENAMHAPLLLAGVGLLLLVPVLMREEAAPEVRTVLVALLALSPLLIYHSRTARPYALTSVLTLLAIVAFRRWWRAPQARRAWLLAYGGATFLAGWLHPLTLPFTLLPIAFYGCLALWRLRLVAARRGAWVEIGRLGALLAALLAILAAALIPAVVNDWDVLSLRSGVHEVTPNSVYHSLWMLLGANSMPMFAVLAVLGSLGALELWRRDREWLCYLALIIVVAPLAIVLTKPMWIHHALVLARYSEPILPLLLLMVAEGLVALGQRALPGAALPLVTGAACAALFLLGPVPGWSYDPNQFMGHARFQLDYDVSENPLARYPDSVPIPDFYRQLASRPARSLTLIEMPWRLESHFNPQPWYQEIHRQYVRIGLVTPVCSERTFGEYPETAGIDFRNFAHLSAMLRGETYGADYLVVHRKIWSIPPGQTREFPDMDACLPKIEAALGAPVLRDDQIVVFDLKTAREPAKP